MRLSAACARASLSVSYSARAAAAVHAAGLACLQCARLPWLLPSCLAAASPASPWARPHAPVSRHCIVCAHAQLRGGRQPWRRRRPAQGAGAGDACCWPGGAAGGAAACRGACSVPAACWCSAFPVVAAGSALAAWQCRHCAGCLHRRVDATGDMAFCACLRVAAMPSHHALPPCSAARRALPPVLPVQAEFCLTSEAAGGIGGRLQSYAGLDGDMYLRGGGGPEASGVLNTGARARLLQPARGCCSQRALQPAYAAASVLCCQRAVLLACLCCQRAVCCHPSFLRGLTPCAHQLRSPNGPPWRRPACTAAACTAGQPVVRELLLEALRWCGASTARSARVLACTHCRRLVQRACCLRTA